MRDSSVCEYDQDCMSRAEKCQKLMWLALAAQQQARKVAGIIAGLVQADQDVDMLEEIKRVLRV